MRSLKPLFVNSLRWSILLLVTGCGVPTLEPAQVKGTLIDASSGEAITGAHVQLWRVTGTQSGYEVSFDKEPVAETETDGMGVFLFKLDIGTLGHFGPNYMQ